MPLTLAALGQDYIIKRIGGNPDVRAHLQNCSMGGNLIVNIKNTRIAISKEMAGKIMI